MKLRLEHNCVKLRLSKEEINKLKSEKKIAEFIHIERNNAFEYGVWIYDGENCMVNFNNHSLRVHIPSTLAGKWFTANQIGIREIINAEDGKQILLVVEEDLPPRQKAKK